MPVYGHDVQVEIGSVFGAIAVIAIPLIAWLWPRLTREGRLLARIARLSAVYQSMPPSPTRDQLGVHITRLGADLLEWIDSDSRAHRAARHWLNAIIFGAVIVVAVVIRMALHLDPTLELVVNIALGLAAGMLMVVSSEWLDRRDARRRVAARESELTAAQQARAEAFRRGEEL